MIIRSVLMTGSTAAYRNAITHAATTADAVPPFGGTLLWADASYAAVFAAATSQTDSTAYGLTGHSEPGKQT
jgi:alpha-glucuronidase